MRTLSTLLGALTLSVMSGCRLELLEPAGAVGAQEKTLILAALGLMLLVVVPVIVLTLVFAWRYRASNPRAAYAPKWAHSTVIEVVVWTVPCVIVAILGAMIWRTTRALDPYRPLESTVKPVRVDVIALDWKWLFIYPDYGVASVNRLAIPVNTPVDFRLTAASLMNSFFIPRLGTQVYAMAGMQTQLHLVADEPGIYRGMSAAFSGEGFSDMHFEAVATSGVEFENWIRKAKESPQSLDAATYRALEKPTHGMLPEVYAGVAPELFEGVVNRFMRGPQQLCLPVQRTAQASPTTARITE
jgi:cytochrome o ubiquinol oxidase subunit 2